ncbi:MAG: YbhB/YbcL family Raf kinase inhibitor-like protein [Nanoarchaeota archaeon]|nr:YbhB/YbcL family Raf kinase inhibitor-like protein [Nanoarchaeota archaeon]
MRYQLYFPLFALIIAGCALITEIPAETDYHNILEGDILTLSSPAFEANGMIPPEYTCDGDDVNPPIMIEGIPPEAKSMALIVDDPDASKEIWVHWVVYNIDSVSLIDQDTVPGIEGTNSFKRTSYGGPCPPSGTHRYFFKVYALDAELGLEPGASKNELENAMQGHILDSGTLIGTYSRD